MAKKHLLPQENEEFLERLGLTEKDQEVYISILDSGLVSAGEVQHLTEIKDLGKVLESIRDLIDIGLVRKAKGTMPRYYATLPFFRETLSVERDFRYSMESMLQSLEQAKQQTIEKRERITSITFPKLVDELLDKYYQELLSPVISDLESLKKQVNDTTLDFVKEIDAENENIKEEISLMLKPLKEYANLLKQNFDLGLTNEQGELTQYITDRKNHRLNILKEVHSKIGENLEKIKAEGKNVVSEVSSAEIEIRDLNDELKKSVEKIEKSFNSVEEQVEQINGSQKEIHAEMLVTRQQIRSLVGKAISTSPDNPTVSENDVDDFFESLTSKINKSTIDPQSLVESAENISAELQKHISKTSSIADLLAKEKVQFNKNYTSDIQQLGKELSNVLNQLHENDDKNLSELRDGITKKMELLREIIVDKGAHVREKLQEHEQDIINQQEQIFSIFQDKMSTLYQRPVEIITPFLDDWVDKIEPIIDQFQNNSDEALMDIIAPIKELEDSTFAKLTERIGFVKAMIEGRSSDIQQIIDAARKFDYAKTSDTWVVTGLPAIYASLTDQLLRTKTKVTVVTPTLDLELVELARSMKSSIRVTFVANIDPDRDARLIKKIDDVGSITIRHYPKSDLYACNRDSEEIIMGYLREGEEAVGIRASTPSVVELLQDRLNETVIRESKPI